MGRRAKDLALVSLPREILRPRQRQGLRMTSRGDATAPPAMNSMSSAWATTMRTVLAATGLAVTVVRDCHADPPSAEKHLSFQHSPQVPPLGVHRFYQSNLFSAKPSLDLLFARYRCPDVRRYLRVDQPGQVVSLSKAG